MEAQNAEEAAATSPSVESPKEEEIKAAPEAAAVNEDVSKPTEEAPKASEEPKPVEETHVLAPVIEKPTESVPPAKEEAPTVEPSQETKEVRNEEVPPPLPSSNPPSPVTVFAESTKANALTADQVPIRSAPVIETIPEPSVVQSVVEYTPRAASSPLTESVTESDPLVVKSRVETVSSPLLDNLCSIESDITPKQNETIKTEPETAQETNAAPEQTSESVEVTSSSKTSENAAEVITTNTPQTPKSPISEPADNYVTGNNSPPLAPKLAATPIVEQIPELDRTSEPDTKPESDIKPTQSENSPKAEASVELLTSNEPVEPKNGEVALELSKVEPHVEILKSEAPVEPPKNEAPVEPPKSEAPVEPPKSEAPVELPKIETHVELPKIEAQVELFTIEALEEPPKSKTPVDSSNNEAPAETPNCGAIKELPKSETTVEPSKNEGSVKIPKSKSLESEEPVVPPTPEISEALVQPPTTEKQVEPPTTEIMVEQEKFEALLKPLTPERPIEQSQSEATKLAVSEETVEPTKIETTLESESQKDQPVAIENLNPVVIPVKELIEQTEPPKPVQVSPELVDTPTEDSKSVVEPSNLELSSAQVEPKLPPPANTKPETVKVDDIVTESSTLSMSPAVIPESPKSISESPQSPPASPAIGSVSESLPEPAIPSPEPPQSQFESTKPVENADSLPDISTESLPSLPEPVSENLAEPMSLPPVDSVPEPIASDCPASDIPPPSVDSLVLTNGNTNGLPSPTDEIVSAPPLNEGLLKQVPTEASNEVRQDGDKPSSDAAPVEKAAVEE